MKREIHRDLHDTPAFKDDGKSPVDLQQVIKEAQERAAELGTAQGSNLNSVEFYDEENTAKALTLFAQGAAYSKVEKETGLSRHTLIRLKFDHAANIEKMKPYFARKFAVMADVYTDLLMERANQLFDNPEQLEQVSPDRLAVTVGVMTDKAAQLAGMPAAYIEHRKGSSIEDAARIIAEAKARIAEKTMVVDAEVIS